MSNVYMNIKNDKMIRKFCFYGFFKNLKFFEPYLLIFLLDKGLTFFEIGTLYSIREIFKYIFEVPSGIIADNYGKKNELMACFIFYIISFVFFFFGENYFILAIGMLFFGLGEAFRSGTHKAMIYTYLERQIWFSHKSFVYGRTRSFSLLGSSLSAVLSIIFILTVKELNFLFLFSIIPYIIDFLLIKSYPDYLNERKETDFILIKFFELTVKQLKSIMQDLNLIKLLFNVSVYDSIFKSLKDYIQPIIQVVLLSGGALIVFNLGEEDTARLYLGIFYGIIYIINSVASRNIYRLVVNRDAIKIMNMYFILFGLFCGGIAIAIKMELTLIIMLLYAIVFLLYDTRRPIFVDVAGDLMDRDDRATVLSMQSQLSALLIIIFSPLFGMIVDVFSLFELFISVGIASLVFGVWLLNQK